jgi:NAD(P)-dependent dehydrogenase (short-subunit alcohol dehydrogenase family)
MSIEIDLEGRTAIVTGAAGGVGRATVAALRAAGASVGAEDIDHARSNVRGVFVHARAALPSLLDSRGTMVNVASVSGVVGTAGQAAYCTTKGAVVQITRQLAVEFGPRGVRVNAVGPGAIDTEFVARSLGLEPGDRPVPPEVLESHPLGRVATPQEIADVIAFLASPLSGFMTGSIVMADGGATAR